MKSKNDKKNTATKNEVKTETAVKNDAVKNDAVKPQNVSTFPVFPTKLSAKTEDSTWKHCAEIPKVPELELVTYRELASWLAEGNGEVMWANNVLSNWNYSSDEENKALDESLSVRKWDDTEWHKPTREYLGLDD